MISVFSPSENTFQTVKKLKKFLAYFLRSEIEYADCTTLKKLISNVFLTVIKKIFGNQQITTKKRETRFRLYLRELRTVRCI